MEQQDFRKRYEGIWVTFSEAINQLIYDLIEAGGSTDSSLHEFLNSLQSVPYEKSPAFFGSLLRKSGEDESTAMKTNIGPISGLFFEIVAASIVKGYMQEHIPVIPIELNRCSNSDIAKISKNPDIYVHHNGRHVIFETKASPKKGDLERVIGHHEEYSDKSDTRYFLVGGHVSANQEIIQETRGWACFTSGFGGNNDLVKTFRLDPLLEEAVAFLQSAT